MNLNLLFSYTRKRGLVLTAMFSGFLLIFLFRTRVCSGSESVSFFWHIASRNHFSTVQKDFSTKTDERMPAHLSAARSLKIFQSRLAEAGRDHTESVPEIARLENEIEGLQVESACVADDIRSEMRQKPNQEHSLLKAEASEKKKELARLLVFYGRRHPDVLRLSIEHHLLEERLSATPLHLPVDRETLSALSERNNRLCLLLAEKTAVLDRLRQEKSNQSLNMAYLSGMVTTLSGRRINRSPEVPSKTGTIFLYPGKLLILFLAVCCMSIFALECLDPFFFTARVYFPTRPGEVLFVLNHNLSNSLDIQQMLVHPDRKVLLIDLFPEAGLGFQLSSDFSYTVDDYLSNPGMLKLSKMTRCGETKYFPLHFGSHKEKVLSALRSPSFYSLLVTLREKFQNIVVHLPARAVNNESRSIFELLGRIRIVSRGITGSEVRSLAPASEVLLAV
ncbi:MAG: hypothetical protein PHQ23_00635 [Candidatus Wallbacteria bacterium]|nr:hypothetical protein [Candidatus Wallbacteria bacterium]